VFAGGALVATFWNRINTVLLLLVLLVVIGAVATRAWGGPLDPPGTPAPTDGVREPGTPISSLPFTITQPGSYYVTRNLTAPGAGQNGIVVNSDDVTLDLGGFTLTGLDLLNGFGVSVGAGHKNVIVRNGILDHWNVGVNAQSGAGGTYTDLTAVNSTIGMWVVNAIVKDCTLDGNTEGIILNASHMSDCNVTNTTGNGIYTFGSSLIEHNYFANVGTNDTNLYAAVYIDGEDVVVRENYQSNNHFVIIGTSRTRIFILGNRYKCVPGITGQAGAYYSTYPQQVDNAVDRNYCNL
jgi:hypothetical protein